MQVLVILLLFMTMTVLPLLSVTGRGRKPGKPQRTKHSALAPFDKLSSLNCLSAALFATVSYIWCDRHDCLCVTLWKLPQTVAPSQQPINATIQLCLAYTVSFPFSDVAFLMIRSPRLTAGTDSKGHGEIQGGMYWAQNLLEGQETSSDWDTAC